MAASLPFLPHTPSRSTALPISAVSRPVRPLFCHGAAVDRVLERPVKIGLKLVPDADHQGKPILLTTANPFSSAQDLQMAWSPEDQALSSELQLPPQQLLAYHFSLDASSSPASSPYFRFLCTGHCFKSVIALEEWVPYPAPAPAPERPVPFTFKVVTDYLEGEIQLFLCYSVNKDEKKPQMMTWSAEQKTWHLQLDAPPNSRLRYSYALQLLKTGRMVYPPSSSFLWLDVWPWLKRFSLTDEWLDKESIEQAWALGSRLTLPLPPPLL